jgi:ubiquinone/menaquinone biosynthesis C-methylase UbiE
MVLYEEIKKIPTHSTRPETESILNKYPDWFYPFSFTNGAQTTVGNEQVLQIHRSRSSMIFPYLDDLFGGKWDSVSCCDIACNQGWFSTQIALRGAKKVIGIDARKDHIKMAEKIRELSGISSLSFEEGDLFNITPEKNGTFTLTLFLGILYHLDNPMGALRILRSLTEKVCILETQVATGNTRLECTWGTETYHRNGPGIAILSSDEMHVHGGNVLTFVPSVEALHAMLFAVGFSRIYQCIPSQNLNEQYRTNDRVILFAFV